MLEVFIGAGIAVSSAALIAAGRWLWQAGLSSLKDAVREPAVELAQTIGVRNGNGDLMTMVARAMGTQAELLAGHQELTDEIRGVRATLDERTALFDELGATLRSTQEAIEERLGAIEAATIPSQT